MKIVIRKFDWATVIFISLVVLTFLVGVPFLILNALNISEPSIPLTPLLHDFNYFLAGVICTFSFLIGMFVIYETYHDCSTKYIVEAKEVCKDD